MRWLEDAYPDLVPRYVSMYKKAYASSGEQKALGGEVASIVRSLGGVKRPGAPRRPPAGPQSVPGTGRTEKEASPEQLELL